MHPAFSVITSPVIEIGIPARFWLFTECVFGLLLGDVLCLPRKVFDLHAVRPRKDNVKRLQKVQQYFAREQTPAELCKAPLCLQ